MWQARWRGRPSAGPWHGWAADAAPPGNATALAAPRPDATREMSPWSLDRVASFAGPVALPARDASHWPAAAQDVAPDIAAAYRPRDWSCDPASGVRWPAGQFWWHVAIPPAPGADVKGPWELGRFTHLGALAAMPGERGAHEFLCQTLDFIGANPLYEGVQWRSAMDVALRAANWCWGLRMFEPVVRRTPRAAGTLVSAILSHTAHVTWHLDYFEEAGDDHYLAELMTLAVVGAAFPEAPDADAWVAVAAAELAHEMERQVYDDGWAHMASTSYHRLMLEFFGLAAASLERIPLARRARIAARGPVSRGPLARTATAGAGAFAHGGTRALPDAFYRSLRQMAVATATLTKPDGRVPPFGDNDSARALRLEWPPAEDHDHRFAIGVAAALCHDAGLAAFATSAWPWVEAVAGDLTRVGPTTDTAWHAQAGHPTVFATMGYGAWSAGRAWLGVTCGTNGMQERGGHGHNDKGGFELQVAGHDVIVDGGCPAYTARPDMRNRFRSTAAHSTLVVRGREQDPLPPGAAGLFELPSRCHPSLVADRDALVASHVGYGARHARRFVLRDDSLDIMDDYAGDPYGDLHFNLAPALTCDVTAADAVVTGVVRRGDLVVATIRIEGADAPQVIEGAYSAGYGRPVPNRMLVARRTAPRTMTRVTWDVG
jgi:hypothetical protein